MSRLSASNLPKNIQSFSYNREAIDIGIVHFGIGNFHRAHQAVYVEGLLETGETQWGIAGVSMRSNTVKAALEPQDYLYTLAILGEQTEYRVIGAVKDIQAAPEQPQAVIDLLANPTTQLVSSTITEKGYYLSSGNVDFDHPAILAELKSLDSPTTIYGYIARGLIQRTKAAPKAKLTIMCCDNISGGGEHLKAGVQRLLEPHDKAALIWVKANVSFISSMVDRVSPATDDKLRDAIYADTGRQDAAPVTAEPFSQWIIEDNFAGARPAFDKVGAVFVDDIAPFERMKLRYLNAAHTMASTIGYLYETTYVHEALEQAEVFAFVRQALYKNVLPNAEVPEGYDGAAYIEEVIKRFQNSALPYANLQVGTDSSQKIQQRWFPTIEAALGQKGDCAYFAFCLAAWTMFIRSALKNDVLNDPKMAEFKSIKATDFKEWVKSCLEISNAKSYNFYGHNRFIAAVLNYAQDIETRGIDSALNSFLAEHANS